MCVLIYIYINMYMYRRMYMLNIYLDKKCIIINKEN